MLTNLGDAHLTTDHPDSRGGRPVLVLANTGEARLTLQVRDLTLIRASAQELVALAHAGYHLARGYRLQRDAERW